MVTVTAKPFGDFLQTPLPEQFSWIEDGILPRGGTMILCGASKIGKSFICLELCRSLALGEAPFNSPHLTVPVPARVLYVEDEVKEAGLQKRGLKIFNGVDLQRLNENLYVLSGVPEVRLDTVIGWKLLGEAVEQVQPNVLILDPLGKFIGAADENRNDEMAKILNRLEQMLKNYAKNEMSLILAHHSKKPDTSAGSKFDPLSPNSMRGASRLFANPDTIVMVERLENIQTKTNHRAWKVRAHFETRQAEGLEDMIFTVNHDDDLRVRYSHTMGESRIPKLVAADLRPKLVPRQLAFAD